MDIFFEKTEMSDVIFQYCSKLSGKISKANFEKRQLVLKPPMNLRTFLQIPEYNIERDEYVKKKTKIPLPLQYSMSFSGKHAEVVNIIFSIKLHIGKDMDDGH